MTTTPDAPTDDDSSAGTGEADDDANFIQLSLTDLTTRHNTLAPPTPTADPPLLPLDQLDPSVLERVVAELVSVGNHLSVQFYGRSGQKQYGLDIVEYRPGAERTVYQVKRYTALAAAQLEQAVGEFAGPPNHPDGPIAMRRFQPTRFVR